MTQPTPRPLTPRETQLAEALVSLVDYTGRVLLTALAGTSPHYLCVKARSLADAANRVADLAEQASRARDGNSNRRAGQPGTAGTVRLPAISRAVAAWSQAYTAGRVLFPRIRATPRATRPGAGR